MSALRVVLAMSKVAATRLGSTLQLHEVEVCVVERCGDVIGVLSGGPPVDGLLTQVSLPDGNWRDVIERLHHVSVEVPVVVVAPHVSSQLWLDAIDCGVLDVVQEPRTSAEFVSLLELIRKAGSQP